MKLSLKKNQKLVITKSIQILTCHNKNVQIPLGKIYLWAKFTPPFTPTTSL